MGQRIDYYDDPEAPKANSLVPSVNVVVVNDAGDILMIRRSDNENWAVPGGAIDLGESMTQAAIRETKEESGIDCEITGLVGSTPIRSTSSSIPATTKHARSSPSSSLAAQRAVRPPRATNQARCAGCRCRR
jgi:ADP-ribose pyrophosphatase YjhB (NUDIX family)